MLYTRKGAEDEVMNAYDRVSSVAQKAIGLRLPLPEKVNIRNPQEDTILLGSSPFSFGEHRGYVMPVRKGDGTYGVELTLPEGVFIANKTLAHEGAHAWQFENNPELTERFLQGKGLPQFVAEGWATRIEELVGLELGGSAKMGSKLYGVASKLPWPLNTLTTGRGLPYTGGRNMYERIGKRDGWDAEMAAAKECLTDSDLVKRAKLPAYNFVPLVLSNR